MDNLHQERLDLAKIILYDLLVEKRGPLTQTEGEVAFFLSADQTIKEALKKETPASS